MNRSPGILKVVFVILLLVTFGELGYYVYIQFNIKNNKMSKNQNTTIISTIVPRPTGLVQAINPEFRAHLDRYVTFKEKPKDSRILLINETSGIVVEIDKDGSHSQNKSVFPFGIKVKNRDIPEGGWTYFSKPLLEKTKVYMVQPDKEILGTLDDIKIGSNIIMRDTSDVSFSPFDPAHIVENIIKIY